MSLPYGTAPGIDGIELYSLPDPHEHFDMDDKPSLPYGTAPGIQGIELLILPDPSENPDIDDKWSLSYGTAHSSCETYLIHLKTVVVSAKGCHP